MVLLDRERTSLIHNLRGTEQLKEESMMQLKFLSRKYNEKIIESIVRIQRWFRAIRQRNFFVQIDVKERFRLKAVLKYKLDDMSYSVDQLKTNMDKQIMRKNRESNRDKAREQFEEAMRKA